MEILNLWNHRSIKTRAVITQIILILIPVFLCTMLLIQQISYDSAASNAGITYQYDRYIIDGLDTAARQMESMANTIAGNGSVKAYVAMKPGEERDRLYESAVKNLLKYSYNRYLPTHNIEVIPGGTMEDLPPEDQVARYHRSEYRMWCFDIGTEVPQCRFYYQFEGNDNVPGLLIFTPSNNMLTDPVASVASINNQRCVLMSSDGKMLYSPDKTGENELALLGNDFQGMTEGYRILKDRKAYYCIRCEALPLMFVSLQPAAGRFRLSAAQIPSLLICAALIAASIFISYQVFFKGITKRIIRLSDACESLQLDLMEKDGDRAEGTEGHSTLALPSAEAMGQDEIGVLAKSINNMLGRIGELSRLHAKEVRAAQRTAYDMLAAQIHPHFIYNTLENLRMMAEINDDQQVADQLYALGRMLRLSISDATSTGDVSMEIEHAQMYLQLQKMRLNNQLEYTIETVSTEMLHLKCPRFLLQPLVENALKHGFQQKNRPEKITISAGTYEKGIWLRVFNDGVGLSAERLAEVQDGLANNQPIVNTKGGIGLVNVNSRLKLFYGPEAGLTIESAPEKGTTCTLWLATNK